MDAPPSLVRLVIGGLLLDPRAYRAQRDHPSRVQRGILLVVIIAAVVSLAALIGNLGAYYAQPDPQTVTATVYEGIVGMPWYQDLKATTPELARSIDELFTQNPVFSLTPTPQQSLVALVIAPFSALLGWFIGGSVVHIAARAFGGVGQYGQTLATIALTSSVNLLGLVQLVPFAEQFPGSLLLASALLGSLATYVAVRETHGLAPWRAFWAVLVGPLLVTVLLVSIYCCFVLLVAGAAGSLMQGAAR